MRFTGPARSGSDGDEVALVIETDDDDVVAFEVKAAGAGAGR